MHDALLYGGLFCSIYLFLFLFHFLLVSCLQYLAHSFANSAANCFSNCLHLLLLVYFQRIRRFTSFLCAPGSSSGIPKQAALLRGLPRRLSCPHRASFPFLSRYTANFISLWLLSSLLQCTHLSSWCSPLLLFRLPLLSCSLYLS